MFPSLSPPVRLAALLAVPLVVAALTPAPAWSQEEDGASASLAITSVIVIDVREGVARPDRTVVIEGDRITAVGPADSIEVPTDARVVDGTGKHLIPGLWDMHVHSSSDRITRETFLPLYVANGVTGVRDMRADCFAPCDEIESPFEQVQEWRRDIAAGQLEGPRIVASSAFIQSPPTGEASSVEAPETAAEVRVLVDRLAERGVDFLKVYSMLSREGFFALAEAARARDLPFAGHVPLAVRASEASQAGLRSIEHLTDILIQCSSREQELRGALLAELRASWLTLKSADLLVDAADSHSDEKCQTLATRLAENGTWVTPTLRVARWLVVDSDDPRLEYQAPEERAYWAEELAKQPSTRPRAPRYWRREQELVPVLEEAGVPILAGSDVGTPGAFPGFGLQDELELLVEVGLTPAGALRAATLEPARYLDATDSLGTVEEGKLADLVLLDANPLVDITNTREIAAVVLDGRYLDREALDQLLEQAERAANPPDAAGDSVSSQDRSPAGGLQSDTVHVAPPTGEKETDRASILAALEEVEPGGTVLFSPGTYLIGEFLRVEVPRITLQGHPDGTTLRGCDPDDYPPYREQLGRCNGLELATGHVTVRGLMIEHAWHGIYIGCCFEDLARSFRGEGEGPPLAQPGGHLIEDNRLRSVGTAMRVIGESSEPIVIRDNVFRNTAHALVINGGTAHVLDNDIAAPEPERVPSGRHPLGAIGVFPAPPARDCGPNVIAGNRVEGHPDGIGLAVGVPGTRCERNVVRDNTIIVRRVPIGESGQMVRLGNESDSTVVGVPIDVGNVAGGEGLPLPSTWRFEGEAVIGNHLIEGNRVQGAVGLGIEIRRSSGNRIVDNVVTGIERRDPFPGNVANSADPEPWREANGSGIWLSPGSDGNDIVGNRFEDIAAAAVVVEGDTNRVELTSPEDAVRDHGTGNRIDIARSMTEEDVLARTRSLAALQSFVTAFENADLDPFLGSFSPSTTLFSPFGDPWRKDGREDVADLFRPMFERIRASGEGPPYGDLDPKGLRINPLAKAAVVTFHLPGEKEVGRRTLVFGRDEPTDPWRIVHLHASGLAQPREGAGAGASHDRRDPETVVMRQVEAYNAHDLDAFLRYYHEDATYYNLGPDTSYIESGKAALRESFSFLNDAPNGFGVDVTDTLVTGPFVVLAERLRHTPADGPGALVVYEVREGLIRNTWIHYPDPIRRSVAVEAGEWPQAELTAAELERFEGRYGASGQPVTVALNDEDRLQISFGGETLQLVPEGDHVFALGHYEDGRLVEIRHPQVRVVFQLEEGEVVGYELQRAEGGAVLRQLPRIR